MRSRLVALFTFCVLVSSLPVLAQEPGQRVLTPGCWGEDVFWCQRKLMDIGCSTRLLEDMMPPRKSYQELQRAHG